MKSKTNQIKTKFIAHRGLSSQFYENTKKAFLAAAKKDYFWAIETDIYRDLNNNFWCSHDNDPFLQIDNNKVLYITKMKTKDIKTTLLDTSKGKFNIHGKQYLTTLDDYLLICKKYNKHAVIEIKQGIEINNNVVKSFSQQDINDLINLIHKEKMINNTTLITFKQQYIKYIILYNKINKTNIKFQQLIANKNPVNLDGTNIKATYDFIDHCINNGYSIDVEYNLLTKRIIDQAHKYNLIVNAWTVDNQLDQKKLIDINVDQITTNLIIK